MLRAVEGSESRRRRRQGRSARAELPLGQGLTPDEVTSWTVGSCSHETKAASCYAMLQPTATIATGTIGFHWGDAGIAAAATLGIVLLIGGLGVTLISRRGRPDPTAHA